MFLDSPPALLIVLRSVLLLPPFAEATRPLGHQSSTSLAKHASRWWFKNTLTLLMADGSFGRIRSLEDANIMPIAGRASPKASQSPFKVWKFPTNPRVPPPVRGQIQLSTLFTPA